MTSSNPTPEGKTYTIAILDKDYRSLSYEHKSFKTDEEAREYCGQSSWTGETYFIL